MIENAERKLIDLADSVRNALGDYAHTHNPDLLNSIKISELYEEAGGILGELCAIESEEK